MRRRLGVGSCPTLGLYLLLRPSSKMGDAKLPDSGVVAVNQQPARYSGEPERCKSLGATSGLIPEVRQTSFGGIF
jgi:hypothetical protein